MNDTANNRRRIVRRVRVLLLLIVAALGLVTGYSGYTWWRLTQRSLPPTAAGTQFVVQRGESLRRLARDLAAHGVLEHAWDLTLLARFEGEGGEVRAGEYRIPAGMTAAGLLAMMVRGEVVLHRFTIVPGTTFREVVAALDAAPDVDHSARGLDGRRLMTRLGAPGRAPEGLFFPDTYFFPRGTAAVEILARAYASMQSHLQAQWAERASGLPLKTPYQALILASIVEKETAVPSERPRIAGVFERRLQRGMRLGADPTVIYGLGSDYNGDITRRDLARDTPYNTYLHHGLPPTPICMPGLASLHAVLHPAAGTALYFVAKGDGTHVFSDTLAEQERMIRKYQLKQDRGNGGNDGAGPVHHP